MRKLVLFFPLHEWNQSAPAFAGKGPGPSQHSTVLSGDCAADALCALQVEQELQRAASQGREVEERQARLKVDQQRLELQLAQAKEGMHSFSGQGYCNCHHFPQVL